MSARWRMTARMATGREGARSDLPRGPTERAPVRDFERRTRGAVGVMSAAVTGPGHVEEVLAQLDHAVRRVAGRGAAVSAALAEAHTRSVRLAGAHAADVAGTLFLGDALALLVLERDWAPAEADALLVRAAELSNADVETLRAEVLVAALRDPRLLAHPPRLAADVVLRLLVLLAPVEEASLWAFGLEQRLHAVASLGPDVPGRGARQAARAVLAGTVPRTRLVCAVSVELWQRPAGALVVRARRGRSEQAEAFAREAAAVLGPVLERDQLLARQAADERIILDAAERRLGRIGFDLHDGPLQDLALLRGDLRLLRRQLEESVGGELKPILLGRVDDLAARLGAADDGLRAFARSFESPALLKKPFRTAIEEEVRAFAARAGIRGAVTVKGELDSLTASQRIAIFRIVQEALANVREHSGATEVTVSVQARNHYVDTTIADNGAGFDVESASVRARSAGRLGLVGMAERARLLGGMLTLDSRPGGPTSVVLTLPEWRPPLLADNAGQQIP